MRAGFYRHNVFLKLWIGSDESHEIVSTLMLVSWMKLRFGDLVDGRFLNSRSRHFFLAIIDFKDAGISKPFAV